MGLLKEWIIWRLCGYWEQGGSSCRFSCGKELYCIGEEMNENSAFKNSGQFARANCNSYSSEPPSEVLSRANKRVARTPISLDGVRSSEQGSAWATTSRPRRPRSSKRIGSRERLTFWMGSARANFKLNSDPFSDPYLGKISSLIYYNPP